MVNTVSWLEGVSTGVTDLLDLKGGDRELLRLANALLVSLAFALFALGCLCLIGDANLLPTVGMGSSEESPPGKCLEHTRDWDFNRLSSIPNSSSHRALLASFGPGKR